MKNKRSDSLNYYFLNSFLHPKPYPGYKQSIIGLIINKNASENSDKVLFIQEKTKYWFLPKSGVTRSKLSDGFFDTIAAILEKNLGLRGMAVYKTKPKFTQVSYIFDFDRQKYSSGRSKQEKKKGNPAKGKIYHLAIMQYEGEEEFDIKSAKNIDVLDFKWVDQTEAMDLIEQNSSLIEDNPGYTETYQDFQKRLLTKILNTNDAITALKSEKGVIQKKLF